MKRSSRNLTLQDRVLIQENLTKGLNKREIAEVLGVSPSTVYQELSKFTEEYLYSAQLAQAICDERHQQKLTPSLLEVTPGLAEYLGERILSGECSLQKIADEITAGKSPFPGISISRAAIRKYISTGRIPGVTDENKPRFGPGRRKK